MNTPSVPLLSLLNPLERVGHAEKDFLDSLNQLEELSILQKKKPDRPQGTTEPSVRTAACG
jgi:hypothetical protein